MFQLVYATLDFGMVVPNPVLDIVVDFYELSGCGAISRLRISLIYEGF
jgi:hypothetical protein